MEELLRLPGVGRKTANLILGDVYHTPGVVVADTHCIRISGLLGLTDGTKDPGKVEQQLRAVLPGNVAVLLVIISVVLTLICGLIPARSAAKKDPVVALRTE